MAPEPNLKSQIHSLRHEIADRTAEIQRLENMAKGMRSSYSYPSTPSRGPNKVTNGSTSPLNASNATNGTDENRLTVRSPSTTRMITALQKEMDAIKTSSEAARAAADAERASREAIQRKCEKLEEIVEVLRMENSNMNGLLSRKERIMKQESELRKTLEQNFNTLQSEKSDLQAEIQKIQNRLSSVEEALAHETAQREKSDVEYAALRSQVNQASERSRMDLQALRAGIQTLKKERKDDARTMQLMAAEIDRLSAAYATERDTAGEIAAELAKVKDKQKEQIERALRAIKKQLEEQMSENQENEHRTGQALAELRAINGKIRAVDPDLR